MTRAELPAGTVTFLFTDIEGSTRLLHDLGADAYAEELAAHRRVLREAFAGNGGIEVDTQGDAFFVAFPTAPGALAAARSAQDALAVPVRMGIHTGTPLLTPEGYVGADVHRAARVASAGHGGQVLVSAATAALADDEALRDLGEHRLKDLSAPERIFQLGDGDFPRLKTLYQTNLPVPATPFLGRERELAEIAVLVEGDGPRLVTLCGPGGTGKTRLGLQAAGHAAEAYPDGVFWVPLAPLRDPALVLEQATRAVGSKNGLADHLGDKRLLLLLDNFEHVIPAARDVATLLSACPNVRLLVTSRELLDVEAEQAYAVPPLDPQEGVELFSARARATHPSFTPGRAVEELCEKLDNLPLALELAAARLRVLSPEQLLERLATRLDLLKGRRDADPRQQTLRATIAWSYDLLGPEERDLFARLAVFRGGCTLEAAEKVADADVDSLQSLVDKSLVRRSGERFWMLETIREFARERLAESRAEPDLCRRHAEHFLAFVEHAEHDDTETAEWLDLVAAEHDNLRSALEWSRDRGENETLVRIVAVLTDFWQYRGFLQELRSWLARAREADVAPSRARRRVVYAEAMQALHRDGDDARAAVLGAELRRDAEDAGDAEHVRLALNLEGTLAAEAGDFETARTHFSTLRDVSIELGDRDREAAMTVNLGVVATLSGDLRAGLEYSIAAAQLFREVGEPTGVSAALVNGGWSALGLGDAGGAEVLFREAVAIAGQLRLPPRLSLAVAGLGAALVPQDEAARGTQLLGASAALREQLGSSLTDPLEEELHARAVTDAAAALGEDAFATAWARGQAMTFDEIVEFAR
jgi:predicted ATPase